MKNANPRWTEYYNIASTIILSLEEIYGLLIEKQQEQLYEHGYTTLHSLI